MKIVEGGKLSPNTNCGLNIGFPHMFPLLNLKVIHISIVEASTASNQVK